LACPAPHRLWSRSATSIVGRSVGSSRTYAAMASTVAPFRTAACRGSVSAVVPGKVISAKKYPFSYPVRSCVLTNPRRGRACRRSRQAEIEVHDGEVPELNPTACLESLMLKATLSAEPGRPPRSTTLPPLQSGAQPKTLILHWACAEPAVLPSRPTAARIASPHALQSDMSLSPACKGADTRTPNLPSIIPAERSRIPLIGRRVVSMVLVAHMRGARVSPPFCELTSRLTRGPIPFPHAARMRRARGFARVQGVGAGPSF
jgi:hypothetical protein